MKIDQPRPTTSSTEMEQPPENGGKARRYLAGQVENLGNGPFVPTWFKWCFCLAAMLVSIAVLYRLGRYYAPGRAIEIRGMVANWSQTSTDYGLAVAADDFHLLQQMQVDNPRVGGRFTAVLQARGKDDYQTFLDGMKRNLQQHETLVLYLQAPAIINRCQACGSPDIDLFPAGHTPNEASQGFSLTRFLQSLTELIDQQRKVDRILLLIDVSQFQGELRIGVPHNSLAADVGKVLQSANRHPQIAIVCQTQAGPPVWTGPERAYSLFALKVAYALHGGPDTLANPDNRSGYIMADDLFDFLTGGNGIFPRGNISNQHPPPSVHRVDESNLWIAAPRDSNDFRISALQPDFSFDDLITDTSATPTINDKSPTAASTSPAATEPVETKNSEATGQPTPGDASPATPVSVRTRPLKLIILDELLSAWQKLRNLRNSLSATRSPTRWSNLHHWLLRAERHLVQGSPGKSRRILIAEVTPLLDQFEQAVTPPDQLAKTGADTRLKLLTTVSQTTTLTQQDLQIAKEVLTTAGALFPVELQLLLRTNIEAFGAQWATSEIRAIEGNLTAQRQELLQALTELENLHDAAPRLSRNLSVAYQHYLLFAFITDCGFTYNAQGANTRVLRNETMALRQTLAAFNQSHTTNHLDDALTQIHKTQRVLVEYAETALRENNWQRCQTALRYPDLPVTMRKRLLQYSINTAPLQERLRGIIMPAVVPGPDHPTWLAELRTFLNECGSQAAIPADAETPDSVTEAAGNWLRIAANPNAPSPPNQYSLPPLQVQHLEYLNARHALLLEIAEGSPRDMQRWEENQLFTLINAQQQIQYLRIDAAYPLANEGRWQVQGTPLFGWTAEMSRSYIDSRASLLAPSLTLAQLRNETLARAYWTGAPLRLRRTRLRLETQLGEHLTKRVELSRTLHNRRVAERNPKMGSPELQAQTTVLPNAAQREPLALRRGPFTLLASESMQVQPGSSANYSFTITTDPLATIAPNTRLTFNWFTGPEDLNVSVSDHTGRPIRTAGHGPGHISLPLDRLRTQTGYQGQLMLTTRAQPVGTNGDGSRATPTRHLLARLESGDVFSYWFPWPLFVGAPPAPDAEILVQWPNSGLRPDTLELLPNQTAPLVMSVAAEAAVGANLRLEIYGGTTTETLRYALDKESGSIQPLQVPDNFAIPITNEKLTLRLFDKDRLLDEKHVPVRVLDPWQCFRAEMSFAPDVGEVRAELVRLHVGDIAAETNTELSQLQTADTVTRVTDLRGIREAVLSKTRSRVSLKALLPAAGNWQQRFALSVSGIPRAFRFYFPPSQLRARQDSSLDVSGAITSERPVFAYSRGKRLLPVKLEVDAPGKVQVRVGIDANRNHRLDLPEVQLDESYFKGREEKLVLRGQGAPVRWQIASSLTDIQPTIDITGLSGRCALLIVATVGNQDKTAEVPFFVLKTGPPVNIITPAPNRGHQTGQPIRVVVEIPDGLAATVDHLEYGVDRDANGRLDPTEIVKNETGQPQIQFGKTQVIEIPTSGLTSGDATLLVRTIALIPRDRLATEQTPAPATSDATTTMQELRGPLARRKVRLGTTGTLRGVVLLPGGTIQPKAYVQLDGRIRAQANTEGIFEFRNVTAGAHRVVASSGPRRGVAVVQVRPAAATRSRIYLTLP